MLHARVVRPPHYHARLQKLDESVRRRLGEAGVRVVCDGSFVAVATEDEYAAVKAAERVAGTANWHTGRGIEPQDVYERLLVNDRVELSGRRGCATERARSRLGRRSPMQQRSVRSAPLSRRTPDRSSTRDGLAAQLEGGLLQAASWTLYEEVRFDRDGITSRDWESYPILRFDNIPEIETVLMDRPGEPFLGAGEATPGPTAGAIANAIRDATGLRLYRLPFTPDVIRAAAMK